MSGGPVFLSDQRSYRLIRVLGRGGFGEVWRAELRGAHGFSKPVAIKVLDAQLDEAWARRLRDEARMLSMVHHRSVVKVDELVRIQGRWGVVMELVEGWDLAQLLASGALPPRVAAQVVGELAQALEAVHTATHPSTGEPLRLVHRDVKPSNIRISLSGEVKLLDFGISSACFQEREAHTVQTRMGSAGYLAPERLHGEAGPAVDVFAAGVVLAEALLGRRVGQLPARTSAYQARVLAVVDALAGHDETMVELVQTTLSHEPLGRPTAHTVARTLRERESGLDGPWLQDWVQLLPPTEEPGDEEQLETTLGLDGARYQVGEELGRGGSARVYSAWDRHLQREVALKELHLASGSHDSTLQARARFLREARITAQLEHGAVTPVFEVVLGEEGSLSYTMRRVRGRTLRQALDHTDGLQDRLDLLPHLVTVCQAVAAAHARGIVHRDLKPANIMLGEFGETTVLDWGLAKVHGQDEPDPVQEGSEPGCTDPSQTRQGQTLGTPPYMSPEQASGQVDAVDARSDVWALGAVLFEVLAGQPAFQGHPDEVLGLILSGHVPAPPTDCPSELAAVAQRAMAHEPSHRYAHAGEVAQDLLAWLTGRRVEAYHYGPLELLGLFVRRYRWPLVGAALALTVLGVQGALSWSRVVHEGEQARMHLAETRLENAEAALARGELPEALALVRSSLEARDSVRGRLLWERIQRSPVRWVEDLGLDIRAISLAPDGSTLAVCDDATRLLLYDAATGEQRVVAAGPVRDCTSLAMSADGGRLALGLENGGLQLWDLDKADHRQLPAHKGLVSDVGYDPEGHVLSAGMDGSLRWWDEASGSLLREEVLPQPLTHMAISEQGEVVVSTLDGELWTTRGGLHSLGHQAHAVRSLDLRGSELLLGDWAGQVWRLHLDGSSPELLDQQHRPIRVVAHRPDGGWVAAGQAGLVRWDGGEWARFGVRALEVGAHGRMFLATDREVVALDAGRTGLPWRGHGGTASLGVVSEDGGLAASLKVGEDVIVWDLPELVQRAVLPCSEANALAMSPSGRWVAVGQLDGLVRLWEISDRVLLWRTLDLGGRVEGLSFTGGHLLGASATGVVRLWSVPSGDLVHEQSLPVRPRDAVLVSADQALLATTEGLVRWQPEQPLEWLVRGDSVKRLALSPDRQTVAWSGEGELGRVDLQEGTVTVQADTRYPPLQPGFSPDGSLLAYPARGIRVLDLQTGTERSARADYVGSVGFTSADELLVVGDDVGTWRLDTLERARRAPVVLTSQGAAMVGTERGWTELLEGTPASSPGPAWEEARTSRYAAVSADGSTLCLWRGGAALEMLSAHGQGEPARWSLGADLGAPTDDSTAFPPSLVLHAVPGGCVAQAGRWVSLHRRGQEGQTLAEGGMLSTWTDAQGISVLVDELLVRFDPQGIELGRERVEGAALIVPAGPDHVVVKAMDLMELHRDGSEPVRLQGNPLPTTAGQLGPGGETLVLGTWQGEVGLWERRTGRRLDRARLNGEIRHLAVSGSTVVAVSATGDSLRWDLELLNRDRCTVLREVWDSSPRVLEEGFLVERAPQPGHPCAP